MQKSKKKALCHPDRPHLAKGLCSSCYQRAHWSKGGAETYKKHVHSEKGIAAKRRRYAIRKEIRDTAKSIPCTDCRKIFSTILMEFDHLPEFEKQHNIAKDLKDMGLETLKTEIEKCEVVCVMCHRVRTWNRLHPNRPMCVLEGANVKTQ